MSLISGDINKPIHVYGYGRYSPLITSLIKRFYNASIFLIENGVDVNMSDIKDGTNPLHLAVIFNQTIVVKSLIEHGAEINIRDKKHKMTPLDRAVSMGHVEMVKLLINNGADAMNEALRLSIVHKNVRIAEMFLKNGVDINHMNEDGDTALHCATKWSNIDTVQLLLNYGANVNIENNDGKTPLYYVRGNAFQHKEISDLLIRHGVD